MFLSISNHKLKKFKQILILIQKTPVQPGNLIILTISIVIAKLGIAKFVTRQKHRRSPAAHQYGTGIADHPESQIQHFRIIGLSFRPAVPASVIIGSIGIIPSIGFVMFCIIRIQIIQGKSIMTGQKIDTGIVSCVMSIIFIIKISIQISGSRNTPRGIPGFPEIPLQETSDRIPVSSIPFCPPAVGRKASNLIQSVRIPCFRDQLHIFKNRIIRQILKQRRIIHWHAVLVSSKNTGKVKTETIHPVIDRPVSETFQNHLLNDRMIAV